MLRPYLVFFRENMGKSYGGKFALYYQLVLVTLPKEGLG
jgi:hypothetical protein